MSASAAAVEPTRPGQESFLTRAVFADQKLWLLSDDGTLSSLTETAETRTREDLPDPVWDICRYRGDLVAVTAAKTGADHWSVRRRVQGNWVAEASVSIEGDGLQALDCKAEDIALLTSQRLVDLSATGPKTLPLSGKLGAGGITSTFATPEAVFVGLNAGEWGGGLSRIDRRSGVITVIERGGCGGPLSKDCDPVNGITEAPGKPGCIIAAIGLVHMLPHGRLVEVCGEDVKQIYVKPYEVERFPSRGGKTSMTVAFFGLVQSGATLQAVGIDGLYRFGQDGTVQTTPLPSFKEIDGIRISFELPDLVLVLTNVNQRRSLSGSVPMLIAR